MIKFWDEKTKKIVTKASVAMDAPVEVEETVEEPKVEEPQTEETVEDAPVEEPKSTRSRSRK